MKTKTYLLLIILISLLLLTSACSDTSNQPDGNNSTSASDTSQSGTSLSQVNMLLVGTLKLEDTDQAISADEAQQLLPLWQAYRSLSTSQTAAEAEVEALLSQIQSSMTSEQMQAIKAMNLTSNDMLDTMQSMGGGMGPRGTPDPQSTPGFDFPGGGFPSGSLPDVSGSGPEGGTSGGTTRNLPPGGAMPGGGRVENFSMGDAGSAAGLGGGPMLQGTPDPSMQATAQARFSTQANQVNTLLLNVLITRLEALAAG